SDDPADRVSRRGLLTLGLSRLREVAGPIPSAPPPPRPVAPLMGPERLAFERADIFALTREPAEAAAPLAPPLPGEAVPGARGGRWPAAPPRARAPMPTGRGGAPRGCWAGARAGGASARSGAAAAERRQRAQSSITYASAHDVRASHLSRNVVRKSSRAFWL